MLIHGFQKMTLLDYPSKVACTLFTAACNLRCPFCHNAGLVTNIENSARIDEEEILSYLKKRQGILDGVCITGGEPTLQHDLADFIRRVKALGYAVKLDTNGTNPAVLQSLLDEGLVDYVAMDIKNSKEKYAATIGMSDYDLAPIQKSIDLLLEGRVDFEFRTTVVKELHDGDSFRAIGPWIAGAKRYFLQSFVDRETVLRGGLHACSEEELAEFSDLMRPYVPTVAVRGV